jgi:hypothetical protein
MNNEGRGYRWLKSKLRGKRLKQGLATPAGPVRYLVRNGRPVSAVGRRLIRQQQEAEADEMLRLLDEADGKPAPGCR